MVKRTRYGHIVKPADHFQMMVSHCPAPSLLSTLDVLSPSLLPTTFRAVLFTGENGSAWVMKWTRDLHHVQKWMRGHGKVQVSGQHQLGHQPLTPAARSGCRVLPPHDMEWLFHTGHEVYLCCCRRQPLEFRGGSVNLRMAPSPVLLPAVILNSPSNIPKAGIAQQLFQIFWTIPEGVQRVKSPTREMNPAPAQGPSMTSPTPPQVCKGTSRAGRTVYCPQQNKRSSPPPLLAHQKPEDTHTHY